MFRAARARAAGGWQMARRDPTVRNTKQRILDAALEVFGQSGYRGASIDDVAAAAGVTKGAVYYWFVDKDDLARDLQHLLWQRLANEALRSYDPERLIADNLECCFEAFVDATRETPNALSFLREAWFTPALDTAGREDQRDFAGLVQGILEQGMARGELVALDPEAAARILSGALMEATLYVLEGGDAAAALATARVLIRSLAVEARVPR